MSNRNLTILGLVAVVMVALAVIQSRRADVSPRTEQGAHAYLIQGLSMDKVDKISTKTTTDTTVLGRIGDKFFITNKQNYPAGTSKVNELITKVLDVRGLEKVTDNPDNFEELGVDPNSARNIVKFMDSNNNLITGLAVSEPEDGQAHVRLLPTNNVYATQPIGQLPNAPMDFIDTQILDIQNNDVRSVTISGPDGSYTLVNDPNSGQITLGEELPEGKQLETSSARTTARALRAFRINDVMRVPAEKSLNFDHTYSCRLENSTLYTIQIARRDGESFIKCKAEYPKEAKVYIEGDESEEELKQKEDQLLAGDAALDFNERHSQWIYKIAEYKADELTKILDELLEDIPQEEKEQENAGPQEPNEM